MKIGIDIGRVIIGGGSEDTSFFKDDFLSTPEIENAWGSVSDLVRMENEVHFVSKCGPIIEERSIRWLENHYYFNRVPQHRVHFVRKRNLKAPMALALELDIFIDDREDIISSMKGIVYLPILFKSWGETMEQIESYSKER